MLLYCITIFLTLDFAYGTFFRGDERQRSARVVHEVYHHDLAPNFDGYDSWGEERYRLLTNSLGFKDFAVRAVPDIASTRRILLIGDSFTEAIGLTFERSFAGMMYYAGQARTDKVEFLNAGVASYSPIIYYKKTKYLLERGVRFDEVIVFVDTSDVQDEATAYFCIDDDPRYHQYCNPNGPPTNLCDPTTFLPTSGVRFFEARFPVTNAVRVLVKQYLQMLTGNRKEFILSTYGQSSWDIPGVDMTGRCAPLGVDGGIERAKRNMGLLADLLSQRAIPLTVVVYPWPQQLAHGNRDSRQVSLWRGFCRNRCKAFIDLFPAFFAAKEANTDWYERLFIFGDVHYSQAGNALVFQELTRNGL
jgi:hypothetical protein